MREINLNRQLLGLEDLEFGTGIVEQTRAGTKVNITKINAGNLPFDETRTLLEFTQEVNIEALGNSVTAINNLNNDLTKILNVEDNLPAVNSVAQNIVPNLTEILNVDTLASQVTQDKASVSSMKLAVETIYDTFDSNYNIIKASSIAKKLSDGENVILATFGDSTMYGYEVGAPSTYDKDPNAPSISLQRTLNNLYSTGTVLDMAISGSAMFHMMRGYDMAQNESYETRISTGLAKDAKVVYCNHAINDCQSNLDINVFSRDYTEWVHITRKWGKVPVIVTPNPIVPISIGDARKSEQLLMYVNVMRDVAKITNCDIVDNYYYTKKTAKRVTESILVPDGIHPSSELYKQNGRNLLIPFVSYNTLSREGDIASLSGSTYLDTASSKILSQPQTRTGLNFYSNRTNLTETGINMAVVLDEPFKYLSFMALQWDNGAKVRVGTQDRTTPFGFARMWNTYGDVTNYLWDAPFTYECNLYAGLNILYAVYDITYTDADRNAMALNGISVPIQKTITAVAPLVYTQNVDERLLCNKLITFQYELTAGGNSIVLSNNAEAAITVYIDGSSNLKVDTHSSIVGLVSTTTMAASVPNNTYAVSIELLEDEIIVNVGGTYIQHVAIDSAMPPLTLANPGISYSITPSSGSYYV